LVEFTGERVVPGQVPPDLWNEHYARYAFAARLARGKRVLDIGCGTGYGSAALAEFAARVTGVDISTEAVGCARATFSRENLEFLAAPAQSLPFSDGSFDLIVAFEVIEHLDDWQSLLDEARRLLSHSGQFVVSTPNKLYYAESRSLHGPNPYHAHEFEFYEFRDALSAIFPNVALFLQNHVQGIAFQPASTTGGSAQVAVERGELKPEESHFFLAVCAAVPQTGAPTWVYVPSTANVLREREHHIGLLEKELVQKNDWLENAKAEHARLLEMYRAQMQELVERAEWAERIERDLAVSRERIVALQDEFEREQRAAADTVAAYDLKISELEADLAARTAAFQANEQRLETQLQAKVAELGHCVEVLHQTEATVEERTIWARQLDARIAELEDLLRAVSHSRWFRFGRSIGVGPSLGSE
jgi:ubiquinone/menaquinone biosynthesis C-methylase UbiE